MVSSSQGILSATLEARRAIVDIGVGSPVSTVTFNGTVPGATLEAEPGDLLAIDLINNMPELPPQSHTHNDGGTDMTRPHEWTTTNLHTHGLHVSSEGNQDNPFITVVPGGRQQYAIQLPDDHPPGFFWYHPHRHGAVAQQVRGGMAGALIVRGDLDEVPEVAAAEEKVMVFQAIELGNDFELMEPIPDPTKEEAFYPRTQIFWTINGQYRPKISMRPGEVQRWRIVNAAEGKLMSLRLAGHQVHPIAWDGWTLDAPETAEDVMVVPGGRVELLVRAGTKGEFDLVLSPGSSQRPFLPGMPDPTQPPRADGTVSGELVPRTVATIRIDGNPIEMPLPETLPAFAPGMLPVAATREVRYTVHRESNGQFISFGINGEPFDPDRPPYTMKLGTAEEWTVVNAADEGFVHIFHVHVNPFLVTKVNGVPLDKPVWRDTYPIGGKLGDSFTFVMNLEDFTGEFVQHCHVLTHEDLGMMERLAIVP